MENQEKNFMTNDLWLSAFLATCGLVPILKKNDTRVSFLFPSSPDLDKLVVNYHNNCTVNVIDYSTSVKTLKSKMFDMKNGGGDIC